MAPSRKTRASPRKCKDNTKVTEGCCCPRRSCHLSDLSLGQNCKQFQYARKYHDRSRQFPRGLKRWLPRGPLIFRNVVGRANGILKPWCPPHLAARVATAGRWPGVRKSNLRRLMPAATGRAANLMPKGGDREKTMNAFDIHSIPEAQFGRHCDRGSRPCGPKNCRSHPGDPARDVRRP